MEYNVLKMIFFLFKNKAGGVGSTKEEIMVRNNG